MRWKYAVAAGAAVLIGAGAMLAASVAAPESSLDAGERGVVEQVERGSRTAPDEAARFIEDHIRILLSEDVAEAVDGSDLASIFEAALRGDAADGTFEMVVAAVAEEGTITSAELRPVLGEAAAARLAWFDVRINAFRSDNADRWDELRVSYQAAQDFLRETMRDPTVAQRLRQSMADYGHAEVAAAPDAGHDRSSRLVQIGRMQAFFTGAYHLAEVREARHEGDDDALQTADETDLERRAEDGVEAAMWVAFDRFASDPAVRAEAVGEPFADASGALKTDLSESDTEALEAWATNQGRDYGLFREDVGSIQSGAGQVVLSG